MNDVFISYTSADQAWAEWIAWVLEENGYTASAESFEAGQSRNFGQVIQRKIRQYRRVLLVLSETFLQVDVAQPENMSTVNLGSMRHYLIPIKVEACEPTGYLGLVAGLNLVGKTETEAEQTLLEAMQAILHPQSTVEDAERAVVTSKGQTVIADGQTVTVASERSVSSKMAQDPDWPEDYEYRDRLKVRRRIATVQGYQERLTDALAIAMVLIPAGNFLMGSPEDEPERLDREGPQHRVEVPTFCMGKYPVTQAEWRWVAGNLPQVNRELQPNPSHFEGDRHPVEKVSWYDAVEFCDRLSLHTGRPYRLPSEAEWEYACRAGTTTPFHFGETITTDLANYRGTDWQELNLSGSYDRGPKGEYRETTTPVDQFGITNAFGLCDMHGNVYEWCQDHYHSSYEGAPIDGSAWIDEDAEEDKSRILRGGSWNSYPRDCRSANRYINDPRVAYDLLGFRIVCSAPRALG